MRDEKTVAHYAVDDALRRGVLKRLSASMLSRSTSGSHRSADWKGWRALTDEFQDVYCRWAGKRYGLPGVTRVDFDLATEGPWSEVTPDEHAYLEVTVTYADGQKIHEEDWSPDLLNSILATMREATNA
jgi:hypothetical protein